MKKIKHPLTTQRGFGRKTSPRPGLTAPTASPAPEASAASGPSGKTRLTRRFGRKAAAAPHAAGTEAKKPAG